MRCLLAAVALRLDSASRRAHRELRARFVASGCGQHLLGEVEQNCRASTLQGPQRGIDRVNMLSDPADRLGVVAQTR